MFVVKSGFSQYVVLTIHQNTPIQEVDAAHRIDILGVDHIDMVWLDVVYRPWEICECARFAGHDLG